MPVGTTNRRGVLRRMGAAGLILAGGALGGCGTVSAEGTTPTLGPPWSDYASLAVTNLQQDYDSSTGLWNNIGWWNCAEALNATIDYMRVTGDRSYLSDVATTFVQGQQKWVNFIDTYYDDTAWWGTTWIAAYDLTGLSVYLNMAKTIFAFEETGWGTTTCGGGMNWNLARNTPKGGIQDDLFLWLAANLHLRTPGDHGPDSYLDWAQREWEWMQGHGVINAQGLVDENPSRTTCVAPPTTPAHWTYEQGVVMGGLTALYQGTGDRAYLDQAKSIADASLGFFVTDGILSEPCGNACDSDQTQFKGIFIRNLHTLYQEAPLSRYRDFILNNAASIWANDRMGSALGVLWQGPFQSSNASTQSSALECIVAAAAVQNAKD